MTLVKRTTGHVLSLVLLFAIFAASKSDNDDFPLGWDSCKGALDQNIDAYRYIDRICVYKELITQTTQKSPCLFQKDDKSNVLFGLPIQYSWQRTSGRLFNETDQLDTKTSATSWWNDMNYQLSIIPLLGAIRSKQFQLPKHLNISTPQIISDDFGCSESWNLLTKKCRSVRTAVLAFDNYFSSLLKYEKQCQKNSTLREYLIDEVSHELWKAHMSSLKAGMQNKFIQQQLEHLSMPEQKFGTNWAFLVDLLAAARFRVDLYHVKPLSTMLPYRILTAEDHAPFIKDMSWKTNRGLVALQAIAALNQDTKGALLLVWRYITCSPAVRSDAQDLFDKSMDNIAKLVPGIIHLLSDASKPINILNCNYPKPTLQQLESLYQKIKSNQYSYS